MTGPRGGSVLVFLVCLLLAAGAWAEERRLGDTAWALPGIVRVGVVASGKERVAGSGTAGYAYTESQVDGISAHHRLAGSLAAGYVPVGWLELGLRLDGRYDWHPGEDGSNSGLAGDPRLLIRAGTIAAEQLHLGGELRVWIPGGEAPSLAFDATTVDASLLAAWIASDSSLTLAGMAGFRFDNSANSAAEPERYDPPDLVVLGVSEFHAVLLGLGASYRIGQTELLVEVSADLLIGSGAPSPMESPLRASAGVREHLSDSLQLQLVADGSPSSRPGTGPTDPLVPIEPRFGVMAGLCYRHSLAEPPPKPRAEPEPEPEPEPVKLEPTAPTEVAVRGTVTDSLGTPIAGAMVRLEVGGKSFETTVTTDGSFELERVPVGEAKATIEAEGFKPMVTQVTVTADARGTVLTVQLERDLPAGQIRGMVRSFGGKPLSARISIEPTGVQVQTDAQGFFQVNVEPGTYQVTVTAEGYVKQERTLKVQEGGVVVFNADLTKEQ